MNLNRIAAVIGKETREILRDPVTVGIALLMPLVMLFLFGYSISLDVDDVALGLLDQDRSVTSRALLDDYLESGYFRLEGVYDRPEDAAQALQRGSVKLVLVVPPDFGAAVVRGRNAQVQLLIDGTYSATARLVQAYAETIAASFPRPPAARIGVETRVWYNPSLSSVNFVIPGLIGVILMAFPPLLTTLAIAREKESGSIQQVFASPLTPAEFLAGKLVPYGLIAFLEIAMVIGVGFAWFSVAVRGRLDLLIGLSFVYVFCTVGIGLLVSTVTRSQLVAMLLALIVTLMPAFLFSGFLFPVFTMPVLMQFYTRVFPARYFIDFTRSLVMKGSGFPELFPAAGLLILYTAIIFALAVWRFQKKVS